MSKTDSHSHDNPITFTLGKGNQSSICGGVSPMVVDTPQVNPNADPPVAENSSVGHEIHSDTKTDISLP